MKERIKKFNFRVYLKDKRCYNYTCYDKNDESAKKRTEKLYGNNIQLIEQEIGGMWLPI